MSSSDTGVSNEQNVAPAAERLRARSRRDALLQRYLLAVAVAAFLAFLVIFYLPSLKRTESTAREIATAALQLDAESDRAGRLPQMKSAVSRLRAQLEGFDPIPPTPGQAKFVRDMAEAADGLQLAELRFEPLSSAAKGAPEAPSSIRSTPIRIEFESDFAVAHEMIERIERLPRLLSVTALSIKSAGGSSDAEAATVRTEMTVTLYHRVGGA